MILLALVVTWSFSFAYPDHRPDFVWGPYKDHATCIDYRLWLINGMDYMSRDRGGALGSFSKCVSSARLVITPDDSDEGIIHYTPGRPIIASVKLNGRTTVRLILDTGADGSMVKPALLIAAGVDMSQPSARGTIHGIAGETKVSYFSVDFEVAGRRVQVPRVAAFSTGNDVADGLLGRDFLDQFKMMMDPAAGTVTLVPR